MGGQPQGIDFENTPGKGAFCTTTISLQALRFLTCLSRLVSWKVNVIMSSVYTVVQTGMYVDSKT